MSFQKVRIKNRAFSYFNNGIKFEHFSFDNILIGKRSHENFSIYDIPYQTLIGAKSLRVRFNKIDELT